jgi:hypothetical protein
VPTIALGLLLTLLAPGSAAADEEPVLGKSADESAAKVDVETGSRESEEPADADALPGAGDQEPAKGPPEPSEQRDPVNVETPAFPGYRVRDAFRIRLRSEFRPSAGFDDFDLDLYQPSIRLRVTAPLSQRAVLQFTGRFLSSLYEFDGVTDFFDRGPASGDVFDDFFRADLSLQAGFRINESGGLLVEGERWSLLAELSGGSRWEEGAFAEALTGGGAVALGYEIEDLLRVAAGVGVENCLDRSGVTVSPIVDLRWKVTDRFTLRNRGQGVQLEYELSPRFEVMLMGFYDSDGFLLDRRPGLPNDLTFRDRVVKTGAGFEWKISRRFRLNLEAGAVAWRDVRVESADLGTLSKERGDPSPYFDIRFEVRP